MYENAEQLLRDVDLALEWLTKHRLFDRIRSGKLAYQRETDKDKKLELVQVRNNFSVKIKVNRDLGCISGR